MFLIDYFAILMTWAVAAAVLIGIGLLARRAWKLREVDGAALLQAFWLGFSLTIMFLQVWHLWLPITGSTGGVWAIMGLTGVSLHGGAIKTWLARGPRPKLGWMLLSLAAFLWLANHATGACSSVDSGTYHLAGVRWARTYAIVPGLANLNDRLGFNSASFLFVALLEGSPWHERATHLFNGLLLAGMTAQVLRSAAKMGAGGPGQWEYVIDLFWLPYLVRNAITHDISSLSTDIAPGMLGMAIASRLGRMALRGEGGAGAAFDAFFLTTVGAAAICLKLSMIGIVAPAALLGLGVWWFRLRGGKRSWAALGAAVIGPVLLLGPWMVRGVILSGYPLFPAAVFGVKTDWQVPVEACHAAADQMLVLGPQSGMTYSIRILSHGAWVVPWLYALVVRDPVAVLLPAGLALAALLMVWMHRPARLGYRWWLLAPPACGLAYWGLSPSGRYGSFLFWIAAGVGWQLVGYACFASAERASWVRWRNLILLLALAPPAYEVVLRRVHYHRNVLGQTIWLRPGPDRGFWPTPKPGDDDPKDALTQRKTRSGLSVYVTSSENGIVWDAPLPSTRYLNPNLRLRDPGDLSAGFATVRPPDRWLGAHAVDGAAAFLSSHVGSGDVVYIYYGSREARATFGPVFAAMPLPAPPMERVCTTFRWAAFSAELDSLHGRRIWFVFAGWNTPEEKLFFVESWLANRADPKVHGTDPHPLEEYSCDGADVYLFQFAPQPPVITSW